MTGSVPERPGLMPVGIIPSQRRGVNAFLTIPALNEAENTLRLYNSRVTFSCASLLIVSGDIMLVSNRVRSCAAAFGVMIAASPAFAADYYGSSPGGGYKDAPVAALVPNWAGFYLGPSFGWAWSSINAGNNAIIIPYNASVPFAQPGTNGMIGGAQLGYNMQTGNFVYGIELDFGGLDASASGVKVDPNTGTVITVKSNGGFYGDITGRVGVGAGNALLYAKGGFAYYTGNVSVTADSPLGSISQNSGMFTGWTVGGGLEYKLTRTLTMKAEYQYFDVDNTNFSCCLTSSGKLDDNITANTFRLGLNFYLNDLRSPLE